MNRDEVRRYVNQYCALRDVQFGAYKLYARKFSLTLGHHNGTAFCLSAGWFLQRVALRFFRRHQSCNA